MRKAPSGQVLSLAAPWSCTRYSGVTNASCCYGSPHAGGPFPALLSLFLLGRSKKCLVSMRYRSCELQGVRRLTFPGWCSFVCGSSLEMMWRLMPCGPSSWTRSRSSRLGLMPQLSCSCHRPLSLILVS